MARRVRDPRGEEVLCQARPEEITTMKSGTKDQVVGTIHSFKDR